MDRYLVWLLVSLIQLVLIILLRAQKDKLANALTQLLLNPKSGEEFLDTLKADTEQERIQKLNKRYAIGLTNSVTISKQITKDKKKNS